MWHWCPSSCFASEIGIDGPKTPNHNSRLEKKCFESEKFSYFAPKKKKKISEHFCTVPKVIAWCWSGWQFSQADKGIWGFWGDGEAGGLVRFGTWCPAPKPVSNLATKKLEIAEITNHLFLKIFPFCCRTQTKVSKSCSLVCWRFGQCQKRALRPACSISHLATLNFIQHFHPPCHSVTRSFCTFPQAHSGLNVLGHFA